MGVVVGKNPELVFNARTIPWPLPGDQSVQQRRILEAGTKNVMNFGIGVQKDYEGCSVSAGFVGATNGTGMYKTTYTDNGDTKYPFSWGIPLRVSYSF